jgi:hypothetical protein
MSWRARRHLSIRRPPDSHNCQIRIVLALSRVWDHLANLKRSEHLGSGGKAFREHGEKRILHLVKIGCCKAV